MSAATRTGDRRSTDRRSTDRPGAVDRLRPALRALAVLIALLLACPPLALLLEPPAPLLVTAVGGLAITLPGLLVRALGPRWLPVPLAQMLSLGLAILAAEAATGTLALGPSLTSAITGQVDLIGRGLLQLGSAAPPARVHGGGLIVLILLLGLIALVLDTLVVDLDRAGPAGLTLTAFALAPVLMVPGGGPWWTIAGPIAGALLLWLLPSLASIRGTVVAAVASAAVLGLGPVLAPVLPTAAVPQGPVTAGMLAPWGLGGSAGPVMIDDSVSVRRDLQQAQETEVLRYRTDDPQPGYLRLHTLTAYADGDWQRGLGFPGQQASSDRMSAPEPPEGTHRYDLSVTDLASDTLPAPDRIRWADTGTLDIPADRDGRGELALESREPRPLAGTTYAVAVAPAPADAESLRAVAPEDLTGPLDSGEITAEVPPLVASLARQVREDSGAQTVYDLALAYEDYFRGSFAYDLQARTPLGEDPVVSFLHDRRGYCEQFAATFALMMIAEGHPARVAIGFTAGTAQDDEHVVTSRNAHAWPEVWFGPELGWIRFEPTPAAAPSGIDRPDRDASADAAEPTATPEPTTSAAQDPTPEGAAPTASAPMDPSTSAAATQSPSTTGRIPQTALGAVLGLLALAGGAIALVRARRRAVERRWEQAAAAPEPERATALLAWDELERTLARRRRWRPRGAGTPGAGAPGAGTSDRGAPGRGARGGGSPERLDPSLPPRAALADLLAQRERAGLAVEDEDRAAAARLGAVVARARYAPSRSSGAVERLAAIRADAERLAARPRRDRG